MNSTLYPFTKFNSSRGAYLKDIPMEYLSEDHKDYTNRHKNNLKLCDEREQTLLNLKEIQ